MTAEVNIIAVGGGKGLVVPVIRNAENLGFADIENAEDNEFTASFLFGANYKITDNAYIGAKGAYHNVFGPTDSLGIEYDDINVWTFNIALGIEF